MYISYQFCFSGEPQYTLHLKTCFSPQTVKVIDGTNEVCITETQHIHSPITVASSLSSALPDQRTNSWPITLFFCSLLIMSLGLQTSQESQISTWLQGFYSIYSFSQQFIVSRYSSILNQYMLMSSASCQLMAFVQEKTNFESPELASHPTTMAVSGSLRCKANFKS